MRYRKLSPTGDYVFGNNLLSFWIDVPDAVAQAVKTRLQLWTGEFFLDVLEGTPWLTTVFGKHSQDEADITVQERVNGTQGMLQIANFDSAIDADKRNYSVTITIDTIYGPTQIQMDNVGSF